MTFFISNNLTNLVTGTAIYLDNDFLSNLYHDKDLLSGLITLVYKRALLLVDPLTRFEFLRSIFKDVINRERFLNQSIFNQALNHVEIFSKIQDNALVLSKIYAHNQMGSHASSIDLF